MIKKPASALVIVLLLMALMSGVILLSSKAYRTVLRNSSNMSLEDDAERMARMGMEEGVFRYSDTANYFNHSDPQNNPTLTQFGSNSNINLVQTPYYSGYSDSNCIIFIKNQTSLSGLNDNCPYYKISIRNNSIISKSFINATVAATNSIKLFDSSQMWIDNNGLYNLSFTPKTWEVTNCLRLKLSNSDPNTKFVSILQSGNTTPYATNAAISNCVKFTSNNKVTVQISSNKPTDVILYRNSIPTDTSIVDLSFVNSSTLIDVTGFASQNSFSVKNLRMNIFPKAVTGFSNDLKIINDSAETTDVGGIIGGSQAPMN